MLEHHEVKMLCRLRVKMGICGLHYPLPPSVMISIFPLQFSFIYLLDLMHINSTSGIISSLKPLLLQIGWKIFKLVRRTFTIYVKSWDQLFDIKTPNFVMLYMLTIILWYLATCLNIEQLHMYSELHDALCESQYDIIMESHRFKITLNFHVVKI